MTEPSLMGLDMRLLVAVQVLIQLSGYNGQAVTSERIASSIGTHPTYVRQLCSRLRAAAITQGRRGYGIELARAPGEITLLEVFDAVGISRDGRKNNYRNHAPIFLLNELSKELARAEGAFRAVLASITIAQIADHSGTSQ